MTSGWDKEVLLCDQERRYRYFYMTCGREQVFYYMTNHEDRDILLYDHWRKGTRSFIMWPLMEIQSYYYMITGSVLLSDQ